MPAPASAPRRLPPSPLGAAPPTTAPPPLAQLAPLSLDLPRPRQPVKDQRDPFEANRLRVEEVCGHLRLTQPGDAPAFELLVLGCGGGPIETNLSSFLVKPYRSKWTDGCTGIEGGSTIGAVASLVERNPYAFEGFGLGIGVDSEELKEDEEVDEDRIGVGREGGGKAAARVWDLIHCFAITHAHLDHIAGLIISSAACRPPPKPVYGIKRTIGNIERLMDGGVWPMLGCWDDSVTIGKAYHYKHIPMPNASTTPLPLSPSITFTAHPLSHGLDPSAFHKDKKKPRMNCDGDGKECVVECYDSTAFFVREEQSGKELLFFGDVEPDSISQRTFNLDIWKKAAPKIVAGKLSVIFLECSYPSSQPKDKLFGHFSPPFIVEEMVVLADLVRQVRLEAGWSAPDAEKAPLQDVVVVIQHIKDDIFTFPTPASDAPPPLPPKPLPAVPRAASSKPAPPPTFPPVSRSAASRPPTLPYPTTSSPLLSMGPPVPSAPTRRPSSAALFLPSSILPHRGSRVSGDFGGFMHYGFGGARRTSGSNAGGGMGSFWGGHTAPATLSPTALSHSPSRGYFVPPGGGSSSAGPTSPGRTGGGATGLAPPFEPGAITNGGQISPRGTTSKRGRHGGPDAEELAKRVSTYSIEEEENRALRAPREEEEDAEEEEEDTVEETVHERIERELNELEAEAQTGVRYLIALQGMRLVF
ncbi:hypothetical protein Rhopal_007641-T1 [Rhodotorula paludigena]|uniref:Uncharacterized protein n=1 Tax=Rhodotorula paludigena TaxID=86838 RepID=A0AAV5GW93_9BASI|nr:hypothetical protein Rhopal_007641-T1 [Rhodotorula paludigena]